MPGGLLSRADATRTRFARPADIGANAIGADVG